MTQLQLNYSGDTELVDVQTEAPNLLDALLQAHASDSPLVVEVGQLRPEQERAIVNIRAEGDAATIDAVEDELAQSAVDLGLEDSLADAKDSIETRVAEQ